MTDNYDSNKSARNEANISKKLDLGPRWLRIAFWVLIVLLGFVHAWADRHYLVNADTMSYLDVADAYLRRDWQTAINSYWGPLYSWLIALTFLIVDPSPYWKFSVVHLINFAIYIFGFLCFDFMIREVVRFQRHRRSNRPSVQFVTLPDWQWLAFAYSLFIWSSLFLITMPLESPDLLVASLVYMVVGLLLRIRQSPGSWALFAFLGIALGLGYLAKAVMFPLSLIFLATSFLLVGSPKKAVPRFLLALVLFAVVAGPFVASISRAKGRLTFGESGRLNYTWSTNDISQIHWQGEEPGNGVPAHATRKIFADPPIFEFAEPIGGTYPVWFDPTYWNEGITSQFDLRGQLRAFGLGIPVYYELFFGNVQFGLLLTLITLFLLSGRRWRYLLDLAPYWFLILPSIAGLAAYSIISVQARYTAPFLVLLWIAFFAGLRVPDSQELRRVKTYIITVLTILIVFSVTGSSYRETAVTLRSLVTDEDVTAHEQWQVAQGLTQLGINEGDPVAVIGNSYRAFWAHLGGLKIVAEIDRRYVERFWAADSAVKSRALETLASTGAKVVVVERPPHGAVSTGWIRIGDTDFYAYRLAK